MFYLFLFYFHLWSRGNGGGSNTTNVTPAHVPCDYPKYGLDAVVLSSFIVLYIDIHLTFRYFACH